MAQRSDWRSGAALVGALLLALCLTRSYSYLLFHTLVELFTVAVAWSMFFLVWNARRFLEDHYLLLLGIASLFVGVIDAVHMLTYKGMMVLPGHGANLPTQLWIAGRYVQSLSFLAAPLFLRRRLRLAPAIAAYSVITAAVLAATLSGSGLFPDCYVEGAGLTRFKIVSEYVVSAISLASILLLCRGIARRSTAPMLRLADRVDRADHGRGAGLHAVWRRLRRRPTWPATFSGSSPIAWFTRPSS